MTTPLRLLLALGFIAARLGAEGFGLSTSRPADANNPANFAIVVYNANDSLARPLAEYYAAKRSIPPDRVVALKCGLTEEISREDYDRDIAAPLRHVFDERHWWERSPERPGSNPSSLVTANRIRFVVLIRGIPLKIAQRTTPYEGDTPGNQPDAFRTVNAAAVDSELAALGAFTRTISGIIQNPYYRSFARIQDTNYPWFMVVGRIDGPSDIIARRLVDDAVEVEKRGLWGRAYFDARGLTAEAGPLAEGDTWLQKAAKECDLPAVFDSRPEMFETGFPMTETALYLGWYAGGVSGPFTRPDWHFLPGAVAIHIHSYSATSIRGDKDFWVGPLLARGAAATCGNVYEPYLSLTVHFDHFVPRLQAGFTFGEAAYMSLPAVSWMNTVVGDPLYRPFKVAQELATRADLNLIKAEEDFTGPTPLEAEMRAFATIAHQRRTKPENVIAAELMKQARRMKSARIYEGLGLLQLSNADYASAQRTFESARDLYASPEDVVRVIVSQIQGLIQADRKPQALALTRAALLKYPAAIAYETLRAYEKLLAPAPPPAAAGKP